MRADTQFLWYSLCVGLIPVTSHLLFCQLFVSSHLFGRSGTRGHDQMGDIVNAKAMPLFN